MRKNSFEVETETVRYVVVVVVDVFGRLSRWNVDGTDELRRTDGGGTSTQDPPRCFAHVDN